MSLLLLLLGLVSVLDRAVCFNDTTIPLKEAGKADILVRLHGQYMNLASKVGLISVF